MVPTSEESTDTQLNSRYTLVKAVLFRSDSAKNELRKTLLEKLALKDGGILNYNNLFICLCIYFYYL